MTEELFCPFCRTWTDVGPEYYDDGMKVSWNCGCCGRGPKKRAPEGDYEQQLNDWNKWVLSVEAETAKP